MLAIEYETTRIARLEGRAEEEHIPVKWFLPGLSPNCGTKHFHYLSVFRSRTREQSHRLVTDHGRRRHRFFTAPVVYGQGNHSSVHLNASAKKVPSARSTLYIY